VEQGDIKKEISNEAGPQTGKERRKPSHGGETPPLRAQSENLTQIDRLRRFKDSRIANLSLNLSFSNPNVATTMRLLATLCAILFVTANPLHADGEPAPTVPPITALPDLRPSVYFSGGLSNPARIRSAAEAEKFFAGDALATIKEEIDFGSRFLLVFVWYGSGQDNLEFAVAESLPEQITFSLKRGFTRNLVKHSRVFALRKDITWSAPNRARSDR